MLDALREMPTWMSFTLCLGLFAAIILGLAAVACAVVAGVRKRRGDLAEEESVAAVASGGEWPLYDHDGDYGECRRC